MPRGLIVEPSQGCTGRCTGCPVQHNPAEMSPSAFEQILKGRPARPVTIHFAGKHSDPLASPFLPELVSVARQHSPMVSVSTIGLGLKEGWENLPVDRWILSIPGATPESWYALRGNRRFGEFRDNLGRILKADRSMVELVLTVWKASENDVEPFLRLASEEGVHRVKIVFGRYDPEEHHMGRAANLALNSPGCPYTVKDNRLMLKKTPPGCPLAGTLFLDASGILHPCPFTEALRGKISSVEKRKAGRGYSACMYCP